MKRLITLFLVGTLFCMLAQCKKNITPPADEDSVKVLEDGRYIIRTKYFCNGGCFVFRSISNHEAIQWEWAAPETLADIKKDKDVYNPYLWSITHAGSLGDLSYIADGSEVKLINPRPYYTIYQPMPGNAYSYLPAAVFPDDYTDDVAGTGSRSMYVVMVNTDISPLSDAFDKDLSRTFIVGVSDSTYRISHIAGNVHVLNGFFSLITNPNGSDCDEALLQPVWRDTWLCPNTASVNSGWSHDACYTSQVVLENVD